MRRVELVDFRGMVLDYVTIPAFEKVPESIAFNERVFYRVHSELYQEGFQYAINAVTPAGTVIPPCDLPNKDPKVEQETATNQRRYERKEDIVDRRRSVKRKNQRRR
jgi:hypothetical protein